MIRFMTGPVQNINWDQAAQVFERAPLGAQRRDPDKLRRAFQAGYASVYVFDSRLLIGLARALCDGEYQAAVYDVVLLPEYQGQGLGRDMMERLCKLLPVENIILYAVPGVESFYAACGFRRMRTAMARLSHTMSAVGVGYLE
ncbi:MAG: GNAT family N-acetyltransferase [Pseudomonadota bacterium]